MGRLAVALRSLESRSAKLPIEDAPTVKNAARSALPTLSSPPGVLQQMADIPPDVTGKYEFDRSEAVCSYPTSPDVEFAAKTTPTGAFEEPRIAATSCLADEVLQTTAWSDAGGEPTHTVQESEQDRQSSEKHLAASDTTGLSEDGLNSLQEMVTQLADLDDAEPAKAAKSDPPKPSHNDTSKREKRDDSLLRPISERKTADSHTLGEDGAVPEAITIRFPAPSSPETSPRGSAAEVADPPQMEAYVRLWDELAPLLHPADWRVVGLASVDALHSSTTLADALSRHCANHEKAQVLTIHGHPCAVSVASTLGVTRNRGLSDLLWGRAHWSDCIHRTSFDGLSLLPYGSGDVPPAEARPSIIGKLITELKGAFGLTFIDIGRINEPMPLCLARSCDAVFTIGEAGRTKRNAARRSTQLLRQIGARWLGTIVVSGPAQHRTHSVSIDAARPHE